LQRPGRIGGDELDHHLAPAAGGRGAEAVAFAQHRVHHRLLGGGGDAQVDEARAGDLDRVDQAAGGRVHL